MALAATEASLERLQQQVHSGQVGMAAACLRVENTVQTICRDDSTRPFLSLLPRLTAYFFGVSNTDGDQPQVGWVELASDSASVDALYTLLHPNGILFQSCLAYSCCDDIAPFDLATCQLPVSLLFSSKNHLIFSRSSLCKKPCRQWATRYCQPRLTLPS